MSTAQRTRIRRIALAAVLLVVGLVMFFLVRAILHQLDSRKMRELSTPLPAFTFHELGKGNFSLAGLGNGKPVAVFFMHPECDHCQAEAAELSRNLALFADAELMVVSTAPAADLQDFAKEFALAGQPNLHVLHDSAVKFEEWFGESPFPTAIAYNRQHLLRGYYAGGAKMELIREKMDEE